MDQSQTLPLRGHGRNKSLTTIASRPRSSTRGPLDIDDDPLHPPRSPLPQHANRLIPSRPLSTHGSPRLPSPRIPGDRRRSSRSPVPHRSPARSPAISGPKDFSYLLRPEIYQPLTATTVPAAFRNSPRQPSPDTPIPELLTNGHFRAAAIAAVQTLTGTGGTQTAPPSPTDHARIFELLYVRLSCLTLIDATQVAAQEVRALEDVNSAFYTDAATGAHLVPWDLRVLVVRLQAMGFGDPRRAVMGYYELARDARAGVAAALAGHDNSASECWKGRLAELGVRVAGALVEMDDLAGARDHLAGLGGRPGDGRLGMARALLWLHLGDTAAARRCVREGDAGERVIAALCAVADGGYEAALEMWKELSEEMEGDEMVAVNLAVCLLYTGKMEEGREMLEGLVASGLSSHTLLFNLTTMYELCTDRSKALKVKLAEKVAGMEPTPRGWEKSNADFKL